MNAVAGSTRTSARSNGARAVAVVDAIATYLVLRKWSTNISVTTLPSVRTVARQARTKFPSPTGRGDRGEGPAGEGNRTNPSPTGRGEQNEPLSLWERGRGEGELC